MRRLAEHIQKQHKVTEGFGCRHCGFKHSSREVTQSHISVEHQEQENPPAAASALAHYYRRRYKERNAHLLNIPDAAFWQRGAKGGKRACSEEGRCPECDVNITPYNKTNIIRHLRQNHCIVIDIDSTRLLQRHSNREIADIPADVYPTSVHAEDVDLSDIDEHEDAGIIDDGHFDNEVMDWDQIQVDQPLGTNKESGESAPLNGTATLDTPAPCPILSPKAQSTYTRDTFLSCLKEGSILNIKNALGMNETRTFNGRQYRVRRDAPINSILDSKEIVCALLTNSDGSEKVFNNREDFNFHITTDHQGSSYSFTALRRVPKTEVLVARLAKQLRLEHTTTQPSASEDEHIEATAIARKETSTTIRQDTMDKDASDESDDEDALVKQEDHAWAQLRRFFNAGVASRSEAESGSEDDNALSEDREFRRHCNDRYVCLSDKPKQGLVPVIHPPNYLVETLTSIQCMTKEDAKDYLITYCKFCRLLGTNDPNAVRRALGLPSHERREAEDACQRQDSPSQDEAALESYKVTVTPMSVNQPQDITYLAHGLDAISCIINNSGTTNEAYEEELKTSGYTDPLSFRSARRIRGSPAERFPSNAKTSKEIIDILRRAGLSPHCLWVEYSMMLFDRKCMETLIKEAGLSADGILPPHERCWTVVQDFARSLPGLASYQLGRVLKLINPGNPHLHNLHRSESDTAVLHDLLERWLFLYGRLRETRC
ncbi:hypothetical protein EDD37DRAFT_653878 [Exophiala viscosa]|uniref:uncharacterized protein n=1 Tax=Exophiala viscosa TaxID=2486360 RepID=UPI00219AB62F|nr:hypothetical protein EDD37DRAFT_653878 [Exophiala viscosa]